MKKNFYCQQVSGDDNFSIEEWNQTYDEIKNLGLTKKAEREILFISGKHCDQQCESCINIVLAKQKENKLKFGW